jgi:hypothetical protein
MKIGGLGSRISMLAVIAGLTLGAGVAPAAPAGASCPTYELGQPFLPWLDPLSYALVPNGGFENGTTSWVLTGGAKVVSGNERFAVRSTTDRYSLSLPPGSSATSSPMCVRTLDAVMRYFASGPLLSTLRVDVVFTDVTGSSRTLPIGLTLGTGGWAPSLPTPILANLLVLPLLTDGTTWVAFRFSPTGLLGGTWKIDDVYVDPLKGT